jgi:recombination DNA repair RAD52 pathway protein
MTSPVTARFTEAQIVQLSDKLDKKNVKSRSQSGRSLAYIEGWHVIAEANRIFGFDAWERETIYCREVCRYQLDRKDRDGKPLIDRESGEVLRNWKIGYEAKVRVTVNGVVREGTGHGNGTMGDMYDAIESAAKEAETDAMKRAMMTFGNPFGLALYDKTQENVGQPISEGERAAAATIRMGIDMAETLEDLAAFWKEHAKHVKELPPALSDDLTKAKDARKAPLSIPANAAE